MRKHINFRCFFLFFPASCFFLPFFSHVHCFTLALRSRKEKYIKVEIFLLFFSCIPSLPHLGFLGAQSRTRYQICNKSFFLLRTASNFSKCYKKVGTWSYSLLLLKATWWVFIAWSEWKRRKIVKIKRSKKNPFLNKINFVKEKKRIISRLRWKIVIDKYPKDIQSMSLQSQWNDSSGEWILWKNNGKKMMKASVK